MYQCSYLFGIVDGILDLLEDISPDGESATEQQISNTGALLVRINDPSWWEN